MKNLFKNYSNEEIQKMIDDDVIINADYLRELLDKRTNYELYKGKMFVGKINNTIIVTKFNDGNEYFERLFVSKYAGVDYLKIELKGVIGNLLEYMKDAVEVTTDDNVKLFNDWYNEFHFIQKRKDKLFDDVNSFIK